MTTEPTFNYPFTNKDGEKFDRGDIVMIKKKHGYPWGYWKIHTISEDGMAYIRTTPTYTCGGYNSFGTEYHIDDLRFAEHGEPLTGKFI
jgi:hypothetical protein